METVNVKYPSSLLEAIETFSDPRICLDVVANAKWGAGSVLPLVRRSAPLVSPDAADVEVPRLQKAVHGQGGYDLRRQPNPVEQMALRYLAPGEL